MFKVPEWGNDIPKGDVEVIKLFGKNNKGKNMKRNSQPNTKNNVKNKQPNNIKKGIKKSKNKVNGHTKLSRDDHINNRILRRNLKNVSEVDVKNRTEKDNVTSKPILKSNRLAHRVDVSNKVKNKILQRKGKIPKHTSNIENNAIKINNRPKTTQNKGDIKHKNNVDKKTQSLKRKQIPNIEINNTDIQSLSTDEPDRIIVNAKRKKLNDKIKDDDVEDVLFGQESDHKKNLNEHNVANPSTKTQNKKEKLRAMLKRDSNRNVIRASSDKLRERMLERLKAAQFRYLNEKLYTSSGSESQELFKSDPAAFQTYHEGYQLQVKKWPVNPLDLIVKRIQKMPKTHLIADMGCGEAALSKRVPQSVRSFDLVATVPGVEACNMAHTPLLAASMDVVVFCLALMGTDLTQYLLEANRVLKIGGHLLIAEVESRFENADAFSSDVQRLGFSLKKMDKSHQVFFFMEFSKVRDAPAKRNKLPTLSLKPCLYKRR